MRAKENKSHVKLIQAAETKLKKDLSELVMRNFRDTFDLF
ncbi:hypothetical protein LEP1GSC050_0665 [Leptospira broomii serovar Hurstbridge str. 5399]|uniref:Uncharacterized protein n=1 Tax=Leptospira broomii serovar Hurstbridge str. 5399 TaxID=1049789 RepID=T0F780_9LEPT|nr:hypothetical protein LEP1GSC050_0665 [Leptospira broomii serovar Hurstbridge str. 5399]